MGSLKGFTFKNISIDFTPCFETRFQDD